MKTTLITTFAIAVMVFAFSANPVMAAEKKGLFIPDCSRNPEQVGCQVAEIDDLNDHDQADKERDVADSGDEGSTSAASASD